MKNKKDFLEFELFRFFSSFLVAALKTYSQEKFVDLGTADIKIKYFVLPIVMCVSLITYFVLKQKKNKKLVRIQ
jgi:hypothetical protein